MKNCYLKEYNDTISTAKKLINDNTLSFAFLTDLHFDFKDNNDYLYDQIEATVNLAKDLKLDYVVLGGDVIHGIKKFDESLNTLNKISGVLKKAPCPTLVARGNHDDNAYHSDKTPWTWIPTKVPFQEIIYYKLWTKAFVKPLTNGISVHDKDNELSSYYYVDNVKLKKRLIFLDSYDYEEGNDGKYSNYSAECWNKISDNQLKWFLTTALDKNLIGWEYLIISHATLTNKHNNLAFENCDEVLKIISCFNNRTIYKNDAINAMEDFSTAKSKAPLHFFGHTHYDLYEWFNDENLLSVGTCTAQAQVRNLSTEKYADACFVDSPNRVRDTETEPAVDIFIVNDGTLNRIRFGAGADQVFDYKKYL